MKSIVFALALSVAAIGGRAQDHTFPFGDVTYRELNMKGYEKDTSAVAVVLNEFGEAYFDNSGDYRLLFEYHVKIKILKKQGLKYADVEIPLWKDGSRKEVLRSVKASSFVVEAGSMRETKLVEKNVFTENRSQYKDVKKFAIPNAREGGVIEFQYVVETPFIMNFRNWEFQADIPKIYSEYWASIPGNYIYNQTLRGFYPLSKNENALVRDCFSPGGNKADCVRFKYAMKDVPAFIEEDYMTARSNFIAGVNFELSEIRYFDGRVDRVTKEWKDAEHELQVHPEFGGQLRKGKDIVDEYVSALIEKESDPLTMAKKIYDFIRGWYQWNEVFMKYSESGIKKAFDRKIGNVGDINLSLIAALRYAGLDVEPVILSTRDNGLPIELHPVLSDFNYVVAKVNIGDRFYLADATDDFVPFGMLPARCLNGKGRALGNKESYWIDLKSGDRAKQVSVLGLKLDRDGYIRGSMQTSFIGYEAVSQRKKLLGYASQQEYINALAGKMDGIRVLGFEIKNAEDLDKPFVHDLRVEIPVFDSLTASSFLFNPYFENKWEKNPFRSTERLYPVDFGSPLEYVTVLNLEFPDNFEIENLPERTRLALPEAGGRFILDTQLTGNKLSLSNSLTIAKPVFTSVEYHYLKELFNRIIQIQNADLIFKRKL